MKALALVCILSGSFIVLMAQSKPSKAPTAKEIEAMQRQMQQALDKLTTEQRKLMEEMGIAMPGVPNLENAAKIAKAHPKAQQGGLPTLNAKKIAGILPTPTAATLPALIRRIHKAVQGKLSASITSQAAPLWASMKAQSSSPEYLGKVAVGLWLSGRPEMAMLIAGEVCLLDASYAEHVNNYAAMLNMMDAQQAAIPLLQCINNQYPGNATILGNLGQAWYGLGDIKKSEKYLDSAIHRFPKHSQALYTKSQIQEAKGDKAGAAESLRQSMETGFTDEKAAARRRLGFQEEDDIAWPLHIPQDPLGFNKFQWPAFPKNVTESDELSKEWQAFNQQVQSLADVYRQKSDRLFKLAQEAGAKNFQKNWADIKAGFVPDATGPLSARAAHKLNYLLDDKDGGLTYQLQKITNELLNLPEKLKVLDTARADELKQLEHLKCSAGEGTPAEDKEQCCKITNEANTKWLAQSNGLIEETYKQARDLYKRIWSAQAYFYQYTMDEALFEAYKAQFKSQYAALMVSVKPCFAGEAADCKKEKENPFKQKGLQDFDDIACQYYSKLELGLTTIEINCSKMTTRFDLGKAKIKFTEDLNKSDGIIPNAITHGSVDVLVGIGNKGIGKWGPVKAEAGADVKLHVEFTQQGVQEVSVTVEGKVSMGTDFYDNAGTIAGVTKAGGAEIMEKTGKTVLIPGASGANKSVTLGGVAGTVVLNSGNGVTSHGVLSGLKL